mmetsp:Transcript_13926/g.43510  ORF Transcript_13926/g.43510 Transcript_13926/m.43510 type:complete len:260 (-) Transcript_13926:141-920(-)
MHAARARYRDERAARRDARLTGRVAEQRRREELAAERVEARDKRVLARGDHNAAARGERADRAAQRLHRAAHAPAVREVVDPHEAAGVGTRGRDEPPSAHDGQHVDGARAGQKAEREARRVDRPQHQPGRSGADQMRRAAHHRGAGRDGAAAQVERTQLDCRQHTPQAAVEDVQRAHPAAACRRLLGRHGRARRRAAARLRAQLDAAWRIEHRTRRLLGDAWLAVAPAANRAARARNARKVDRAGAPVLVAEVDEHLHK